VGSISARIDIIGPFKATSNMFPIPFVLVKAIREMFAIQLVVVNTFRGSLARQPRMPSRYYGTTVDKFIDPRSR